jgi:hypothetical protein
MARLDRRAHVLARRAWTPHERNVVWRGLCGRFALAIEPLLGMIFMTVIALGIVWRAHHVHSDASLIKIAWIFGAGSLAFAGYFVIVLLAPLVAYLQTFKPIYILDGYVRYREPDAHSDIDSCGYAAALFPDKSVACEWPCLGRKPLPNKTIPALVEFSLYGGIHTIDGKSTGLIPDEDLPPLAIGIANRHGYRRDIP